MGAERPPDRWLIGVEHEKIGVRGPRYEPVPYYGPDGIRALLDAIARSAGGSQHRHKEHGQPIALLSKDASVTLEPGGQLELSGAPLRSFADIRGEIEAHLAQVQRDSRGIAWLATGYRPFGTRNQVPWMPKGRYAAMKSSLGNKGRLALDMMLMTATVQANLDWSDEADLASKVRAATAVSPVVSAMFANSPLIDGRDCGYLDFRYQVWRETDAARLTRAWTFSELLQFQADVARDALRAKGPGGATALDLSRDLLAIARSGLKGWQEVSGLDESRNLDPLSEIVDSGRTYAERALEAHRASGGDPASVVKLWQIA